MTDSSTLAATLSAPEHSGERPPSDESRPPESDSFRSLYRTHAAFVWRSLRRLGVPEDSVDDLTQEVFLIAFRRQDCFEHRSSFQTWLYGIAFNVTRQFTRRAKRFPSEPVSESLLDATTRSPQEDLARNEAVATLYQVLDSIEPERRAVFVMAELEQMGAAEIAELTGAPINTVYSRLRLARRDFEGALKRQRAREGRRQP